MNPLHFFLLFLKASLFSTGGTGNLPSIHTDLMARGWSTDRQFAESLAIGQIAPGPSGLWVISLGFLMDGWRGAMLALAAIIIPPFFVLLLDRIYRRIRHNPAVEGFAQGLSLAIVGIFVVILLKLLHPQWAVWQTGIDIKTISIALASVGLGLTRRVPIVVILLLAGLAGILLHFRF